MTIGFSLTNLEGKKTLSNFEESLAYFIDLLTVNNTFNSKLTCVFKLNAY